MPACASVCPGSMIGNGSCAAWLKQRQQKPLQHAFYITYALQKDNAVSNQEPAKVNRIHLIGCQRHMTT